MAEKKIDLPSGGWALFRDPEEITYGDYKNILKVLGGDENQYERTFKFQEALLAFLVKEWSFDLIPPSIKRESLDQLKPKDVAALNKATEEAQSVIFLNFTEDTGTDSPKDS